MRAKVKVVIDVGMIILVLLQMAYHLIGDSLHGWIGTILFVLLILHNVLDRKWYSGLCKGKYTPVRFLHMIINLLLLASFLCVAVSDVFLSTTLSSLFHFISRGLLQRMFLLSEYVFFNYEEPIILVITDHIAIHCMFSYFTYIGKRLIVKQVCYSNHKDRYGC